MRLLLYDSDYFSDTSSVVSGSSIFEIKDLKDLLNDDPELKIEVLQETKGPVGKYQCPRCARVWFTASLEKQKCFPCTEKGLPHLEPEVTRAVVTDLDDKEVDEHFIFDKEGNPKQIKRLFGFYRCTKCSREWGSSSSWAEFFQQCRNCLEKVYQYKQTKLKEFLFVPRASINISHRQDLCGKCEELGKRCLEYNSDIIDGFEDCSLDDEKFEVNNNGKKGKLGLYKCLRCEKEWYSYNQENNECLFCFNLIIRRQEHKEIRITETDLEEKEMSKYYQIDPKGNLNQLKRLFGLYKCTKCNRDWASAISWANHFQKCKMCLKKEYPYKQAKIKNFASHQQDLCGKCQALGHRCIPL